MYSRIAGTGSYLPEKILTNADLEAGRHQRRMDRTRTGIRSATWRRRARPPRIWRSTRRGAHGGRASRPPADIDLICVGTTTPDLVFPNVGTLLQDRLGIHGCPAFSLEAACTGFVYALSVADKFVRLGESKCALVVGAETLTRIIDWNDRGTCVLFADGAGAVVLKPSRNRESSARGCIPTASTRICCCIRTASPRASIGARRQGRRADEGQRGLQGGGQHLGAAGHRDLSANNITKDQLDWLIPHQANIRIIEAIAKRLDLPMERVIVTIDIMATPRPPRCRWRSIRAFATAA
jgi:3-oxoacyl-[acyl-carrier-protein] synthase-3